MIRKNSSLLNRRTVLTDLAGAAGASLLPFVPSLEQEAAAQVGGKKLRFMYWYESVMPNKDYVMGLYQNDAGPLQFRGAFSPLNEVADKLLFVRDCENRSKDDSNGGPHPSGGGPYLAGRPWKKGLGGDAVGPEGESFGQESTLDQWLASRIQTDHGTPLSDIRAGFANKTTGRGNSAKSISVLDGRLRLRHQTPKSLYAEIFPFLGGMSDPASADRAAALVRERRSVLDFVNGGLKRIQSKVSQADREKLEAHVSSIREVEERLALIEEKGDELAEACGGLSEPNDVNEQRVDLAQDAYIPMLAQALSCDMTRVAGGHFGSHTNLLKYDFVENKRRNGSNWHQSTHEGGNELYYDSVLGLRARQFVKLVKALDAIPEDDGTVLDNTVILWFTDIPWNHTGSDSFTMIAGGSHYFKHGQMINNGGTVNKTLTSICEAMGYGVEHFGDPGYGSGTLPNSAKV